MRYLSLNNRSRKLLVICHFSRRDQPRLRPPWEATASGSSERCRSLSGRMRAEPRFSVRLFAALSAVQYFCVSRTISSTVTLSRRTSARLLFADEIHRHYRVCIEAYALQDCIDHLPNDAEMRPAPGSSKNTVVTPSRLRRISVTMSARRWAGTCEPTRTHCPAYLISIFGFDTFCRLTVAQ